MKTNLEEHNCAIRYFWSLRTQQRAWLLLGPSSLFASCRDRYCLISFLRELIERERDLWHSKQWQWELLRRYYPNKCVVLRTTNLVSWRWTAAPIQGCSRLVLSLAVILKKELFFWACQWTFEAQTSTFTHNCPLLLPKRPEIRCDSQRQNDNSGVRTNVNGRGKPKVDFLIFFIVPLFGH